MLGTQGGRSEKANGTRFDRRPRGLALALITTMVAACSDGGSSHVESADRSGDGGTIAFQAAPNWVAGDEGDEMLLDIGDSGGHLRALKNGDYLRLVLTSADGVDTDVSVPIRDWSAGENHAVAVSWGDGCMAVYVDGQKQGSNTYGGGFAIPPGTPVHLGSDGDPQSNGARIDGFKLFPRPLDPTEIDAVQNGGPVAMSVDSTVVSERGATGEVCVSLNAGGGVVAGTQNDLLWDSSCAALREGTCRVARRTGKSLTTALVPGESGLHALVLSVTDVNAIPDGELYCCEFTADLDQGCCPIEISGSLASDPQGRRIDVYGVSGSICVGEAAPSACD